MAHLYGECTNVAAVNEALAGSGYRAITLRHADGRQTAAAQIWASRFTETTIGAYNAMFIVVAAVPEGVPAQRTYPRRTSQRRFERAGDVRRSVRRGARAVREPGSIVSGAAPRLHAGGHRRRARANGHRQAARHDRHDQRRLPPPHRDCRSVEPWNTAGRSHAGGRPRGVDARHRGSGGDGRRPTANRARRDGALVSRGGADWPRTGGRLAVAK